MTKLMTTTALILAASFTPLSGTAYADEMQKTETMMHDSMAVTSPQSFTKKKYNIKGNWQIVKKNGQTILRLSEDFKTKSGPDLKLFLSPQSINSVTGGTAVNGAVKLAELKSNNGAQDYVIPAGVNLSAFQSLLIHCEAYSVLWGGGAL